MLLMTVLQLPDLKFPASNFLRKATILVVNYVCIIQTSQKSVGKLRKLELVGPPPILQIRNNHNLASAPYLQVYAWLLP